MMDDEEFKRMVIERLARIETKLEMTASHEQRIDNVEKRVAVIAALCSAAGSCVTLLVTWVLSKL